MASDTGQARAQPGAKKSRGRPPGHHPQTIERGRLVREYLANGTPLNYLARAQASHLVAVQTNDEFQDIAEGVVASEAKSLRRQLRAANEADCLVPARRRPSSPALARALKRYHAHSAEHPRAGYDGKRDSPEAWESAATLLDLRVELRRAMAASVGETLDLTGIQRNAARHRAKAEQMRASGKPSWTTQIVRSPPRRPGAGAPTT